MSDEGFDENTLGFGGGDVGEREEEENERLSSSNKRIKEKPIDRLSVLPDSVLVRILSFLYTRDAGMTSVLSKRWKFLWAELPKLEFVGNYKIEKTRHLVSVVNRALDIRKCNYLEELTVQFVYNECFSCDVDAWIEFCVKNEVKKFSLIISNYPRNYNYYRPPQIMYSSSYFTSLYLSRCILTLERSVEWQSLTKFSLEDVELNRCLIDEILSSCPVLYDLKLIRCWGFNRLEVNSRCLNSLEIEESEYEPYVEISAPYIRHLNITLFPQWRKWQLKNIASVVTASIDFHVFDEGFTVEVMSNIKEILEKFVHVKKLQVKRQCFEALSMVVVNGWQLPQSRVQHLTLFSFSEFKHGISGIIGLLKSSPNLETLVLEGYDTEGEIVNLDPTAKDDLDGDLLHLKTVEVNNFADSNGEPLLSLARILLRRAPALDEMVIRIDVEDKSDFVNIAQKLLTYPRSSTKAEIHLTYCRYG